MRRENPARLAQRGSVIQYATPARNDPRIAFGTVADRRAPATRTRNCNVPGSTLLLVPRANYSADPDRLK